MKRSKTINLVLVTTVSALALSACDEKEKPNDFFSSASECTAIYDTATCAGLKQSAEALHENNAPKFANLQECEQQFGVDNCQPAKPTPNANSTMAGMSSQSSQNSSNWFMPAMMGFMVGRMMDNSTAPQATPLYSGLSKEQQANCKTNPGSSDCRSRSGGNPIFTSARVSPYPVSTQYVTSSPLSSARAGLISSSPVAASSSASVSRGGFGASGSAHASSASS